MKARKILAALLALVLALGSTAAFAAGSFTDVPEDAYYAEAVEWAAAEGITTGRGNGVFDPGATVTRAEAVTFLWRMAGKPEPTQTRTFADVERDPNNGWYRTAIQWAVENGITNGTGGDAFSPAVTCSRGMILTMIYRMEGCPFDEAAAAVVPEDPDDWTMDDFGNAMILEFIKLFHSEDDGFADVKAGDYYELPMLWALISKVMDENHVDETARTLKPNDPCPRGEMVYFLYRTHEYELLAAAASEEDEPVAVGTVPETVVLDREGVKITLTGIENDSMGDAVLNLTVVNGSGKTVNVDTAGVYVNTYSVPTSAYVPDYEDGVIFYGGVFAAPGETKDFNVGLNSLRGMGVASVYEIELAMCVTAVTETGDGYEYGDVFIVGDPVTVRTSLYAPGLSYDQDGTLIWDGDGLRVLVCRAENHEFAGPQIAVYAYNGGSKPVSLELAGLKLDGKAAEASFSMDVPAGKRCVETVFIDLDYENIPTVKEAEITLRLLDFDSWEPLRTFDPVTVAFAA